MTTKKTPAGRGTCENCDRPMRPKHTTPEQYPGTTMHGARGICHRCYMRERRGSEQSYEKRPDNCHDCNRRLRPSGSTLKEHPGTVAHRSKGLCDTCYRHRTNGAPAPWPRPCKNCDQPMRPSRSTPDQYPGMRIHNGNGLCQACYMHRRKGGELTGWKPKKYQPVAQKVTAEIQGADPALDRLMAARRERLARKQRAQQLRRTAA